MERCFFAFAVILTAGSFSKGQIVFLQQPKNVTVNEDTDAFFPCTYNGTYGVPTWRINNNDFVTSGLPPKHSYNGTGLVVHNVDFSLNNYSYSCFFEVYGGQGQISDIESNTGFLNVEGTNILESPQNATQVAVGDEVTFQCRFSRTLGLPLWNIGGIIYISSYLPAGFEYTEEGLHIPAVWESVNNTKLFCFFIVYNHGNLSTVEGSPTYLIVTVNGTNSEIQLSTDVVTQISNSASNENCTNFKGGVTESVTASWKIAVAALTGTVLILFLMECLVEY